MANRKEEIINLETASREEVDQKITAMRKAGQIHAKLFEDLREYVKPGMTGKEIDAWVRKEIVRRGAKVAYDMLDDDFPGAICISINDELVHGAPTDEPLESGDKVSFDLDICCDGYFTDSAFTMLVGGEGAPAVKKMIEVTESSMWEGIAEVKPGAHIGDISHAVEQVLKKGHLGVIRNYIGHGIGKTMHESPEVPNYGKKGRGYKLVEGDTICIEPMSCLGSPSNYVDKEDGWTVRMRDGQFGCHCEHTVLVTHDGYEVLTKLH